MPPDIQEIRSALSTVIQIVTQMIESEEELSPEVEAELTQVINRVSERISQQQTPEAPTRAPFPRGVDLLWHLSNGNPEAFISYLENIPDPELNNLLRNPVALQGLIQQLSQREPAEPPFMANGIEKAPLNSSNIWGFNYDPRSGQLLVRFQGGGIYSYSGVPDWVFRIFSQGAIPAKTSGQNQYGRWWVGKQPSLGAAFYEVIRQGGFPYERVA